MDEEDNGDQFDYEPPEDDHCEICGRPMREVAWHRNSKCPGSCLAKADRP